MTAMWTVTSPGRMMENPDLVRIVPKRYENETVVAAVALPEVDVHETTMMMMITLLGSGRTLAVPEEAF